MIRMKSVSRVRTFSEVITAVFLLQHSSAKRLSDLLFYNHSYKLANFCEAVLSPILFCAPTQIGCSLSDYEINVCLIGKVTVLLIKDSVATSPQ